MHTKYADYAMLIVPYRKYFKPELKKKLEKCSDAWVTGHKAQEYYLRRKLKAIIIPGVQIGTFDRFQEREYDGVNHTVEFL